MPNDVELRAVAEAFDWPDFPADEVLAPHRRPVLTVDPDVVRIVLRTARYADAVEQVTLGEMSVLVSRRAIVSIRYGQASPLAELRHELEADPGRLALGPFAVLAAIVNRVVEDYGPALDGFENDVIEAERDVFSDTRRRPVMRIYQLKRQVRELLVAIEALRDPLARLVRTCAGRIPVAVVPDLHEAAEQLERAITRTRSLSELLDAALGATLAQISVRQNEDMRKISAWVAIAAGPTMIAGVYGMNFEHFPELAWRFGYPVVLSVMVALMVGLFRAFRRSGWL
jgi:magnesium transporter